MSSAPPEALEQPSLQQASSACVCWKRAWVSQVLETVLNHALAQAGGKAAATERTSVQETRARRASVPGNQSSTRAARRTGMGVGVQGGSESSGQKTLDLEFVFSSVGKTQAGALTEVVQ